MAGESLKGYVHIIKLEAKKGLFAEKRKTSIKSRKKMAKMVFKLWDHIRTKKDWPCGFQSTDLKFHSECEEGVLTIQIRMAKDFERRFHQAHCVAEIHLTPFDSHTYKTDENRIVGLELQPMYLSLSSSFKAFESVRKYTGLDLGIKRQMFRGYR